MKIGFIGAGNMAGAIISGILAAGQIPENEIIASDASSEALERVKTKWGIQTVTENKTVAAQCGVVVLAVKPQYYPAVIQEISPEISGSAVVVTIAPGQTLEKLESQFGKPVKIVRTMPNTPALVREGMTAVCANSYVTEQELNEVRSLLDSFGKSAVIPESLMDAVVAVSGSAPAYVYLFIEALADGAVREGMPRGMAYQFAAQAVLGSAKMVLETGLHPGALKDMVCSPGGTTIEAVAALEKTGFRSSVLEAMTVCAAKSRKM